MRCCDCGNVNLEGTRCIWCGDSCCCRDSRGLCGYCAGMADELESREETYDDEADFQEVVGNDERHRDS